ncbi:MAG: hypothetical protein K6G78_02000, partial [bacterium]|nr:hypothetical protein [bacterium]
MRGIASRAAAKALAIAAVFAFALCVFVAAGSAQDAYAEWNSDHTHYYKDGDVLAYDGIYYVPEDKGYYFFDEYGFAMTGWFKSYWNEEEAYWYGDPKNYGMLKLGWQKIGGYWYYFAPKTAISQDNKKSYSVGMMYDHGTAKVNNKWYYFGTSDSGAWGKLKDGWFSIIDDYGDKVWYYADPNNDDQLALGWKKISGKWYYFEPNDPGASYNENWYPIGVMHYGDIETIKGHEYYFAKNGVLQSGWIKDTDSEGSTIWYYADPDNGSRLVTGWKKIGGKWYYFEEDKYHGLYDYGVMYSDGINTVKDHDYYFAKNGALQSGWIKEPQKYEYSDGSTESWNDWYYADPNNDSRLVKGWKKIGG